MQNLPQDSTKIIGKFQRHVRLVSNETQPQRIPHRLRMYYDAVRSKKVTTDTCTIRHIRPYDE